jgi:hypothetical protein
VVERAGRITPRAEFFIALAGTLIGVFTIVVARLVDARPVLIAGVVLVIFGAFATVGPLLPKRKTGTRIWETDQGKAI